jgi:hypothetical protein
MNLYFGYLSGICIIISFLPYLISLFKGETKPERASWLIWSILGGIAFFSQLAKGASASLWLPGIQTIGDIVVFILSIKYGMGGLKRADKWAFAVAGLSLVLWYITREPVIALLLAILIDASGAVLTIAKSYAHPTTEPISAWALTGLSGLFALLAVGSFNIVLLLFPLYTLSANIVIVISIKLGQRAKT